MITQSSILHVIILSQCVQRLVITQPYEIINQVGPLNYDRGWQIIFHIPL
jgi:hypothetical protein